MTLGLLHLGPTLVAAFLASLVEFVEALTVVLAVGATRGWAGALLGSGGALLVLFVLVLVLGPALMAVPLALVQVVLGLLLLMMGMRWLRKAALRSAGVIPLNDEEALYARSRASLAGGAGQGLDPVALSTAFKITMIEGLEVIFIVLAMGSGSRGLLWPAATGALAALAVVVLLGAALRRPVARIPENTLKFVVGVLLCAFGSFWIGEGGGIAWPGGDLFLLVLCLGFLIAALFAVRLAQRRRLAVEARA